MKGGVGISDGAGEGQLSACVGSGVGGRVGISVGAGEGKLSTIVGCGVGEGVGPIGVGYGVGSAVGEGVGPIGVEYGVGFGVGEVVGACVLFATLHASGVDSPTNFRKSLKPHSLHLHKPGSSP